MNNKELITNFIQGATQGHTPIRDIQNGYYTYKGSTLSIDGDYLVNYKTIIAIRLGDTILLNEKKYSSTTSKIQSLIKRIALSNNKTIESMK